MGLEEDRHHEPSTSPRAPLAPPPRTFKGTAPCQYKLERAPGLAPRSGKLVQLYLPLMKLGIPPLPVSKSAGRRAGGTKSSDATAQLIVPPTHVSFVKSFALRGRLHEARLLRKHSFIEKHTKTIGAVIVLPPH